MRPIHLQRKEEGNRLFRVLAEEQLDQTIKSYIRMTETEFYHLLSLLENKIYRMDTVMRKAISVKERLAITLRFLASGDSFASLHYLFHISKASISGIVREVCDAIIEALEEYVQ
uniref:DUF8040 domain-containing protein n=1 Tax=Anopheles minimus TaxID=112268 RepID=A0A182VSN9_9DIPT